MTKRIAKKCGKTKQNAESTEGALMIDTRQGAMKYGSRYCVCPKCGLKTEHQRGLPCSSIKCPQCGGFMRGEHCA